MRKPTLALYAAALLLIPSAAAAKKKKAMPENPVVLINTSEGDIYLELFEREAPVTVKNFLGLAEGTKEWTDPVTREKKTKPFYDGLLFHRVIKFHCKVVEVKRLQQLHEGQLGMFHSQI